jgi:hydroxymethylpyrimidine/phosphomethylpyrimidine kinase
MEAAKRYLTEALRQAFPVGGGRSPVHHFSRWWGPEEG